MFAQEVKFQGFGDEFVRLNIEAPWLQRRGYPAETTEAFCAGHTAAFSFFGGVPQSILYDNTKIAVARILGDGTRQRTRVFSELQSHYLFEDRFGRPGMEVVPHH